ncbi:fatty alcohol:caffeoyl-CoA acyltransferase isoform X2 [Selaginella moellendorffii]|uniref:fatty alcohol:caffeoyl-CoA acyltransferase isoform X2 n=1 Tax=Selaginella moellendorffii TaxID=88036 RepID=UPI000D1C680D|nr:fatty alcohol:caffeoyl-CoA acyltransferase isoform X2 [Selaginella moellendorffii]|eukprot:XP_024543253.1 fatty alcohol:caffeoyl-CoA acyltransferase isoform X2 [Selaginella moellendorffii]
MALESSKITVTNICLVSPSYSPENVDLLERKKQMRLCAASHMIWFVPYRTRLLFFRKPPPHLSFEAIVANLKSSLAKALVEFYPLAGRLLVSDSENGLRMDVVCNDKGVLFIEASATGVTVEELAKDEVSGHFEGIPAKLVEDLAQCGDYDISTIPWSFDAPLFIIQVTELSCGGICISVKFNHQLLDGAGTWNFVKSWAEVCCGKSMSLKPVVVETPPCIAVSDDHPTDFELPAGFGRACNADLLKLSTKSTSQSAEYDMKCFAFKKEMIQKMKLENPGFSSFQLLTSFIWSRVNAARDLKDDETTTLVFAANCRGRIKTVPKGFVGMAVVYDHVSTKVSSLRAQGNELRNGADLLKKKIGDLLTEEGAGLYSKAVSSGDRGFTAFPQSKMETALIVGSSFYFPVFEDFGFGKPVGMTLVRPSDDSKLYYFPGKEEGDVVAYIGLTSHAMRKLSFPQV